MYFGQVVFCFTVFLAGIVAGSFANVLISSYCCGMSLRKFFNVELFPIIKFIRNREKCFNATKGFFSRYFLLEFASAGIFFLCYYFFGFGAGFIKYTVLLELLLVISVIDLRMGIVPNRFVLFIFLWVFLWQFIWPYLSMESALTGFISGGALFYVIALASKGGMGGGDIKLMAVLGFAAGWPYVLVLFILSFILGALVGSLLLITKKRVLKDSLPFAPFLSLGFLLTTFWGVRIWYWYASFW